MAHTNPRADGTTRPVPEDVSPSTATYMAVADRTGRDPLELPPLTDAVDADALDAVLEGGRADSGVTSTFAYAGCSVTLRSGEITVSVLDDQRG